MPQPNHKITGQITTEETLRLLGGALAAPDLRGSFELVKGSAISTREFLGIWMLSTENGPRWRVALVDMLDGDPMWDEWFDREYAALAVYTHMVEADRQ